MVRRALALPVAAALVVMSGPAMAQVATWHLHNEASTTSGFKQLKTAGPDVAQATLQTAALQGAATGEKQIAQFDTASGVPNTAGKIPTGATASAVVWMRKTANFGTMFPRVKVRLNSSTGTQLCTATGTTALTTTLTAYTITCQTTANLTLTASDRLYVWAGVNLTVASSGGAFRGELGLEGTLNGTADSRVDIPTALPAPSITTLTPNAGPIGTTVTIAGTNFRDQPLSSTVKFFNNRTATATAWSNTSITVTVPASSATGSVTVTVAGTASAGATFTVGNVPTITNLNPSSGLPGISVVVTGTNFGATKGSSTIKFNGLTAATTAWSATSITATVPAGATSGSVVVTVGGIPSAGTPFTVPTLNSISVEPAIPTVPIGGQQQFFAWGHYSDSVTRDVTAAATWATTDGAVATIASPGGLAIVTGTSGTTTLSATVGAVSGATDLTAAPSRFRVVGSMSTRRAYHTATRLPNGLVLIAGGSNAGTILNSAEVYDPATGRFTPTGSMLMRRHAHTATLLPDGKVLIAGGSAYDPDQVHQTAELYDPATGTFSWTGFMTTPRTGHTATALGDGRVLLEFGYDFVTFIIPPAAEIYDPVTQEFTATGSAATLLRAGHGAARLNDGRVLTTGAAGAEASAAAELYDPVTGQYAPAPSMTTARIGHTTTRLADGRVLVTSSWYECPAGCTAEVYDAAATAVTPVGPLSLWGGSNTATLLNDGAVLFAGGNHGELFDPATNTFTSAGAMVAAHGNHTATLLQDGSVLLAGGGGAGNAAELYIPEPLAPLSLTVTPAIVTMQPGDSRGFTAVDHLGHPRLDAVWSVNNGSVATVDPATGIVTATTTGAVALTAEIGAVSGAAQITIAPSGPLPAGTVRWSVPTLPGSVSRKLVTTAGGAGGPAMVSVSASSNETPGAGTLCRRAAAVAGVDDRPSASSCAEPLWWGHLDGE